MTPFRANPFAYIFPAIVLAGVLIYYGYGIVDRIGLDASLALATVTGKRFNERRKSYSTTVAGDRTWVQSNEIPESYVLALSVAGEPTIGLVSKQTYESLQVNDSVQVTIRRRRLTRRLEVIDVKR